MRILHVEDDPTAAQAVERMLKSKGYACQTTAFGEEAVELAMDGHYDIILLDIMLPDIDGYEVLLRLQAAGVQTPVLIQSGMIGRDEMEKGVGFGVEDYLVKPFSRGELEDRIGAVIGRVAKMAVPARRHPDHYDRRQETRGEHDARRTHPRHLTLKSGQIVDRNAHYVTDCLILNLSADGAAIQLADFFGVPTAFVLKVQNGESHDCEVCWQHGKKIGVRFL